MEVAASAREQRRPIAKSWIAEAIVFSIMLALPWLLSFAGFWRATAMVHPWFEVSSLAFATGGAIIGGLALVATALYPRRLGYVLLGSGFFASLFFVSLLIERAIFISGEDLDPVSLGLWRWSFVGLVAVSVIGLAASALAIWQYRTARRRRAATRG